MDKNYNIQFNRKTRQEIQWRYILNAIQIANKDVSFHSHKEMCEYIICEYILDEWCWDIETTDVKLNVDTFAEFLKQKPLYIAIPHDRNTIVEVGRAWGYCKTENSTERFVATWYERIAQKFIRLCKKLNVKL